MAEEIIACLKCGSRNISALKHERYWEKRLWIGMGIYTCQDCGHEGHPFVLDSMEDYKRFLELKKKERQDKSRRKP